MRKRTLIATTLGIGLVSSTLFTAGASAATPDRAWAYVGTAGGTQVTAVGLTVNSDITAESSLIGRVANTSHNNIASVNVSPLATVGAITSDETATNQGSDGIKLVSHVRTAGVSLLGGVIKISAIDTTSTVAADSGSAPTASSTTELVGLTIAGKKYPLNVPANSGINIPGVASITLNGSTSGANANAAATTGAGLVVTLLKARGAVAAGAEIVLNPTYAAVQRANDVAGGPAVGGVGYGSYVSAHVGNAVKVESGRTAGVSVPLIGTGGVTYTNSTARANLPGVLNVGAIESTMDASTAPTLTDVVTTSQIARVNLFNGLITANAIGSTSHAKMVDGVPTLEGSLQFVNLRVAGKAIPINVGPNTSIHIANLGTVTLNAQATVSEPGLRGVAVVGLDIVLDTSKAGLPIGAEVQLGASQALIYG